MTKAWAKFIGWQYFANKKGWKPLFQLFLEPPTIMNGTTVGLDTLKKYGVEIPTYPPFKPNTQVKEMSMFYCSCGLTFAVKQPILDHIRETAKDYQNHGTSMETVTVSDLPEEGKGPENKVIVISDVKEPVKEEEQTIPDLVVAQAEKEAIEDAKKEFQKIKSPAQEKSDFRLRMEEQYPFLKEAK